MIDKIDLYEKYTLDFRLWLQKNYCDTKIKSFSSILSQDGIFNPSAYFKKSNRVMFMLIEDYEKDDHWPACIDDASIKSNQWAFGSRKGDCSNYFGRNLVATYKSYILQDKNWTWTNDSARYSQEDLQLQNNLDGTHSIQDGVAILNIKKRKNSCSMSNSGETNYYIYDSLDPFIRKDGKYHRGYSAPAYDNVIKNIRSEYRNRLVSQIETCDPSIVFACESSYCIQFSRLLKLFESKNPRIVFNEPKGASIKTGQKALAVVHNDLYDHDYYIISWKHPSRVSTRGRNGNCINGVINSINAPDFFVALEYAWQHPL